MLEEIGYADALIARETPAGLELIDGHLRSETTPDMEVPVLIVDLDENEAKKVLLTLDPLAGMAQVDSSVLCTLLSEIDLSNSVLDENADLRRLLADVSADLEKDEGGAADDEDHKREVPGMALQPHEHYDYLVVLATTSHDWNVLCERLKLIPAKRRGRMGTARAIHAGKLLELLGGR